MDEKQSFYQDDEYLGSLLQSTLFFILLKAKFFESYVCGVLVANHLFETLASPIFLAFKIRFSIAVDTHMSPQMTKINIVVSRQNAYSARSVYW